MLSTVPYRRRAVHCRYGMCEAGARQYFRPGYGRLQSAFEEQEREQKRRATEGYHHGDPTCIWYRCDSLSGPDPGGTLAIDLKDCHNFAWGGSGEKICRLGGSRPCVFVKVGVRYNHRVGQVQFKQSLAVTKGCLQCLKEWLSSWRLRQRPWGYRRAPARDERRPLQRGGSSVLNEALTAKPSV